MDRAFPPSVVIAESALNAAEWTDPEKPRADCSGKVEGRTTPDESVQAEREFIQAIEAYKKSSGRMFPTWSEVLEVLNDLGYVKSASDNPGE